MMMSAFESEWSRVIPFWVFVMRDIQAETGWRIAEVCGIRYKDINWVTGEIRIIRPKESKMSVTRSQRRALDAIKAARMQRAKELGDSEEFMRLSDIDHDDIIETLTPSEERLMLTRQLRAKDYKDTQVVSERLIGILERMHDESEDEFVFSRKLTLSNRSRNFDGPISRQTAWSRLKELHELLGEMGEVVDGTLFDLGYSVR